MPNQLHQKDTTEITDAALAAFRQGYLPIPIRPRQKRPLIGQWTQIEWSSEKAIREQFAEWGAQNVGVLLGERSGGLVDVDLDHPTAARLREYLLPPTAMRSGRVGRPNSHYWYVAEDMIVPPTRRYKLPGGEVSIEVRSNGSQTLIPPSIHPSGEQYLWEGHPWGGEDGPAMVLGRKLAIQVALVGLGAVLLDKWPTRGSRHECYLALAGSLLRLGDGVNTYWKRNLPILISALAGATHDADGADARISEVMGTTVARLEAGQKAVGYGRLAEILGEPHADGVRRMVREIESLSGWSREHERAATTTPSTASSTSTVSDGSGIALPTDTPDLPDSGVEVVEVDADAPEDHKSSWGAVDLEPYLSGEVVLPEPSLLVREDGQGLLYPGRVNSLYGASESGKSWLSLFVCLQEMSKGERVLYLDFEDVPEGTVARLLALGLGDDDVLNQFRYVHPEGPLSSMQVYRGGPRHTTDGRASQDTFEALLAAYSPTLIVVDGMTVLYGLHGLDTNEAGSTEVITGWLKNLCRGGQVTVLVIDHTGKASGPGSSPIGAHHKIAMIQGTALRVDVVTRPMQGAIGQLRLVVFKDRPGVVRAASSDGAEQVAGEVFLDSRTEGMMRVSIVSPDAAAEADAANGIVEVDMTERIQKKLDALAFQQGIQDQILALFGGDSEARITTVEVVEKLGVSVNTARKAWSELVRAGLVVAVGSRKTRYYQLRPVVV